MSNDHQWLVPRHVVSAGHGDAIVLLHVRRGRFYRLNHVGSIIWNSICLGAREDDIASKLAAEFEVEVPDARHHIDTLVGQLVAADLLST